MNEKKDAQVRSGFLLLVFPPTSRPCPDYGPQDQDRDERGPCFHAKGLDGLRRHVSGSCCAALKAAWLQEMTGAKERMEVLCDGAVFGVAG